MTPTVPAANDIDATITILKDLLLDAIDRPGITAQRRAALQDVAGFVDNLKRLVGAEAKLEELEAQLSALTAPPLQYGVFLRAAPPVVRTKASAERGAAFAEIDRVLDDAMASQPPGPQRDRLEGAREHLRSMVRPGSDDKAVVGVQGQEYEVSIASADITPAELKEGQQVVLNKMMNVVGVRDTYLRGDTAEVVNVLSPPGTARIVGLPTDAGVVRLQAADGAKSEAICAPELMPALRLGDVVELDDEPRVVRRIKPRLHVRAGGTEGVVVEVSDQLFHEGVAIGDIVRVDMPLRFAFEKLPAYEIGGLALEEVPDVDYDDIGGLDAQIREIRETIELPYLHRALFDKYKLKRAKGILLHGPPGCGKTMIAKAVANNLTKSIRAHLGSVADRLRAVADLRAHPDDPAVARRARGLLAGPASTVEAEGPARLLSRLENTLRVYDIDAGRVDDELRRVNNVLEREDGVRSFFLNVKGPELLNKYVGETEHRIRKVFEDAKRRATFATPVIVFFDEMEAMFRARGSGLSSDIETTIVPQFLSEMDGVEASADVIVIGASNRPELIDPAILRPGRLDAKIAVAQPGRDAARAILALHLTPDLPMRDGGAEFTGPVEISFKLHVIRRTLAEAGDTLGPDARDRLMASMPPGADVRKAVQSPQFVRAYRDAGVPEEAVAIAMRRESLAEALISKTLAWLYDPGSRIEVVTNSGRRLAYALKEFVQGAVLVNLVLRAKKAAVLREAAGDTQDRGLTETDMREAVYAEFLSNAAQLAAVRMERDPSMPRRPGQPAETVQFVDLFLSDAVPDPWRLEKVLVDL